MFGKKESFANDIIRPVSIGLGMAFFVMFIATSILFLVTEPTGVGKAVKISITLVLYIILYFVLMFLLSKEIRQKFKPLDTLINGLSDESIRIYGDTKDLGDFAESINRAQRKYENLSRELNVTKKDLDDINTENEKLIAGLNQVIEKKKGELEGSKLKCEKILCDKVEETKKEPTKATIAVVTPTSNEVIK